MINEEKQYFMVYLKKLKWTNHFYDNFTYAFDSLSGTELKVSLNYIFSVYPGCDSLADYRYDVENECGLLNRPVTGTILKK